MSYVYLYTVTTSHTSVIWQCVTLEHTPCEKIILKCLKETKWKFATASYQKIPFLEDL